jgi:hypothetical protein
MELCSDDWIWLHSPVGCHKDMEGSVLYGRKNINHILVIVSPSVIIN